MNYVVNVVDLTVPKLVQLETNGPILLLISFLNESIELCGASVVCVFGAIPC